MAITKTIMTDAGESRECYIRINNMELTNHGQPSDVRLRAFISEEAFRTGGSFVAEWVISFTPEDIGGNVWSQAYAAFEQYLEKGENDELQGTSETN